MIAEIGRGGTIRVSLGSKAIVPVVFALLLAGCPKRKTEPRVVYVQPPAAAAASTSTKAGPSGPREILTIEAPPPAPEPPEPPTTANTSATVPTQPQTRKPPRPRADSRASEEPALPDTTPPADAAQAPPLEPAGSAVSEDEIAATQNSVRRRIDGLNSTYYSTAADRQILDDARAFVNQSEQALKAHNLLKAHELVQKASLLLDALQPRP